MSTDRVDNIRNPACRDSLVAKGFVWVTVLPRGDAKGQIVSRHKTYLAAAGAAHGLDLTIVSVAAGDSF